jgi:S1-C subfamily serine protease
MMVRFIDFLFAVAITLLFALILVTAKAAHADTKSAMDQLRKTAVRIEGAGCSGSGSVVQGRSGHHYLITNAHVCLCAGYRKHLYATYEGGAMVRGDVSKIDWNADLCAARVDNSYPALKLGPMPVPYQEVNTRGYPSGRLAESHGMLKGSVSWEYEMEIGIIGECPAGTQVMRDINGRVSGCELHHFSVLSNLYARPGSSGSPVVNDDGGLVGVISSWHPGDDYDAGSVPYGQVRSFLEGL